MCDVNSVRTNWVQAKYSPDNKKKLKLSNIWSFMCWITSQAKEKGTIKPKTTRKLSLNEVAKGDNMQSLELLYKKMNENPSVIQELINFEISEKEFKLLRSIIKHELKKFKRDCSPEKLEEIEDVNIHQTKQFVRKKLRAIRSIKDFQEFQKSVILEPVRDDESVSDSEKECGRSVSDDNTNINCRNPNSPWISSASLYTRRESHLKLLQRGSSKSILSPASNNFSRTTMNSKDTTLNKLKKTSLGGISERWGFDDNQKISDTKLRHFCLTPNIFGINPKKNDNTFTLSEVPESNSVCDENLG